MAAKERMNAWLEEATCPGCTMVYTRIKLDVEEMRRIGDVNGKSLPIAVQGCPAGCVPPAPPAPLPPTSPVPARPVAPLRTRAAGAPIPHLPLDPEPRLSGCLPVPAISEATANSMRNDLKLRTRAAGAPIKPLPLHPVAPAAEYEPAQACGVPGQDDGAL